MKEFKIRCSAIGKIMAGQIGLTEKQANRMKYISEREKLTDNMVAELGELITKGLNLELPQTAKTYCQQWLKEQLYQRRYEFSSKYTEKGIIMEDDSIDMIGRKIDRVGISKNDTSYENDFMTGTPDVNLFDTIIDVKSSWDCFTFPLFDTEMPNADYWWQGQGYMHLTQAERYVLAYTLVDTPLHIITKQAYYYASDNGLDVDDVLPEFIAKMTYPDIDENLRCKTFEFAYNPESIKRIEQRVLMCREYINTLMP